MPKHKAREEAEALALQIAVFPQTCMKNDRLSVYLLVFGHYTGYARFGLCAFQRAKYFDVVRYEQWDLSMNEALRNEFRRGSKALQEGETVKGASRFAQVSR